MKTDNIIVLVLGIAAVVAILVYDSLRIRKELKGTIYLLIFEYDIDKIAYCMGVISLTLTYLLPDFRVSGYTATPIFFFLGKYGKRIDAYQQKLDRQSENMPQTYERIRKTKKPTQKIE